MPVLIHQIFIENVYMPVIVLGIGDTEMNKTDTVLIPLGLANIVWKKILNKYYKCDEYS